MSIAKYQNVSVRFSGGEFVIVLRERVQIKTEFTVRQNFPAPSGILFPRMSPTSTSARRSVLSPVSLSFRREVFKVFEPSIDESSWRRLLRPSRAGQRAGSSDSDENFRRL